MDTIDRILEQKNEQIEQLEEENKNLKERVSELEDVSKDYDILSKDFITATWEIEFRKDEVERFKTNAVQDMAEITELENQIKKLKEKVETLELWLDNKEKLNEEYRKKIDELKFREDIADIVPEWEGHIAEETIQDLQKRIDELVWFEKEYHRSRDRIKKLEWILEHEYGRKVPY